MDFVSRLRGLLSPGRTLALAAAVTTLLAAAPADPKAAYRRPDRIPFPKDNPYSPAKAQLGQTLFFDPRLSGPGTHSCASCHNPALAWKDGLPRGVGHDARQLPRATPTVIDLAWTDLLMWDGRKDGLEDQALGPITSTAEMNLPEDQLTARVAAIPGYRQAFAAAFPGQPITAQLIAKAIATFERTLVSNQAPFDRWVAGDPAALGESAQRGFVLFNGPANCAACHTGWRFTDDAFHDIGLASEDLGRGAQLPDEPSLGHAFKTPTLRNVAQRAPYMHDGSVPTLAAVVRHYDTGFLERPTLAPEIKRLHLSDRDVADLVAFMQSLTSQDDPIAAPTLPTAE